ncbi:hypothetical protein V3C99_005875 [Haemonchus contortus]
MSFYAEIVSAMKVSDAVHVGTTLIGRADKTTNATNNLIAHHLGTDIPPEALHRSDTDAEAIPTMNTRVHHRGMNAIATIVQGHTLQPCANRDRHVGFSFAPHHTVDLTIVP